jgi:thiol-disulfide isomerase/thioredoxin
MQPRSRPLLRSRLRRLGKSVGGNLLLLVVAFTASHLYTTRRVTKGQAPAIVATALDGSSVRVPASDGRARIVHFFATWCGVCSAEEHNLRALADTGQLVLVASDSGDEPSVRAHARAKKLEMPLVIDDGSLKRAYGVTAYPTTFFIDATGHVDFVEVGYTTELGLRARLFATR